MPKQTAPKSTNTAQTKKKPTSRGVQIDFKPRRTAAKTATTKRAVSPRRVTKTTRSVSEKPKTTPKTTPPVQNPVNSVKRATSSTSVKINFGPKKATVHRKTISVIETPEQPPVIEEHEETRELPVDITPEELVADPDLIPDTERVNDFDLEEVFDELEETGRDIANNQNLFDDFENPLDIQQENFIAEPEPLNYSPFLAEVKVEKRPLSGGTYQASKTTTAQFVAPQEENNNPLIENTTDKKPKKEVPTTVIDAAPKKGSGTLGLLMAILATVIAGGFVGAMIYFMFFQE